MPGSREVGGAGKSGRWSLQDSEFGRSGSRETGEIELPRFRAPGSWEVEKSGSQGNPNFPNSGVKGVAETRTHQIRNFPRVGGVGTLASGAPRIPAFGELRTGELGLPKFRMSGN